VLKELGFKNSLKRIFEEKGFKNSIFLQIDLKFQVRKRVGNLYLTCLVLKLF